LTFLRQSFFSSFPRRAMQSDSEPSIDFQSPPTTLWATLKRLGPGMIIAGSIVGSGELIATTKVGAEAGFWLLWLIILGCVIKVYTQVEFGRHTNTHLQTPLEALNDVPGPRWRVNWLVWYWAIMTVLIITQQGGIVGAVGQTLAIAKPLTAEGRALNEIQNARIEAQVESAVARVEGKAARGENPKASEAKARAGQPAAVGELGESYDAYYWAALVAVVTSALLYFGRYELIQVVSTALVAGFTLVTLLTLILLQTRPTWAVTGAELVRGLSFRLPPAAQTLADNPIATALAAFGIIGVGAAELIMYPYWCLEKGYAQWTGPRDGSDAWTARARGWLRVLYTDAWASMVVYTLATVAFYLLGAAVLGRTGLNPEGSDMVRALAQMYVPVFGERAEAIFLFGAFAVLYSTFFVAAAGNARMVADGLGLYGLHDGSEATRMKWTRAISAAWPLVAVVLYVGIGLLGAGQAPAAMVLASGVAQAIMLPMLGVAVLYFRYRKRDDALQPGLLWDAMLWLSFAGFLVAGVWVTLEKLGLAG
jgi:Mn2+/Fe2+ NRAMP family transporter